MTITSKYDGICKKCGGKISRGDQIEWTRESGACHLECPESPEAAGPSYGKAFQARRGGEYCADCGKVIVAGQKVRFQYPGKKLCHEDCAKSSRAAAKAEAEAPYSLSGGSGYGCRGWVEGEVVRTSARTQSERNYPGFLVVVSAGSQYVPEDGLSFGVGDESGHTYWAKCREATEEEASPLKTEIAKQEKVKAAKGRLAELAKMAQSEGERPTVDTLLDLDGERLFDTQNIYGGGDWWVVSTDGVWYVRNNGADGDMWAMNNVATGGAGAIGWKLPYSDDLVAELSILSGTLRK